MSEVTIKSEQEKALDEIFSILKKDGKTFSLLNIED
jgi:hypothetical protein